MCLWGATFRLFSGLNILTVEPFFTWQCLQKPGKQQALEVPALCPRLLGAQSKSDILRKNILSCAESDHFLLTLILVRAVPVSILEGLREWLWRKLEFHQGLFAFLDLLKFCIICPWRDFLFYQWVIETNAQADVTTYCLGVKMFHVPTHGLVKVSTDLIDKNHMPNGIFMASQGVK